MNKLDKDYRSLLQDILDNGYKKSDRTGTGTISVFGRQIRHNMKDGFPLLTTKKMYFKGIVTELLWFLRGDTNIKFLVDNDCHIWDGDAYKKYLVHTIEGVNNGFDKIKGYLDDCLVEFDGEYEHFNNPSFQYGYRPHTQEEFINKIKTDTEFAKKWGELGPIYGKQWRNLGGYSKTSIIQKEGLYDELRFENKKGIDQISNLINDLKTNPDSRRLMVSAWNVSEIDASVLPPCHNFFQFYTRELTFSERLNYYDPQKLYHNEVDSWFLDEVNIPTRAISLMFNMRSTDVPLGLPFNIASYGLLLEIIGKMVNMVPEELISNLGDTHIYSNQVDGCLEQIGRELTKEERKKLYENEFTPGMEVKDDEWLESKLATRNIPKRTREPYPLPKLDIHPGMLDYDLDKLEIDMFKILDYQSHPTIKFPLSN